MRSYRHLIGVGILLITFWVGFKNFSIEKHSTKITNETSFPVERISELIPRIHYIDSIAKEHHVEVMVTQAFMGWNFAFEGFGYRSILETEKGEKPKMVSVYNVDDRRSWLYDEVENCKIVMLYVCFADETVLKKINAEPVGYGLMLIKNNTLSMTELFDELELDYRVKSN